ncbi:MAG: hypothetical protein ACNYPH_04445 [Gammaproteobacteria bacterium WSBS_2016_MAG_OTU1]
MLSSDMFSQMKQEALSILEKDGRSRDLNVATTGNPPRAYQSVGRDTIKQQCKLIPAFFESSDVLELLSTVAGERLYRVPYELEEYIALAKLTRRTVIVFTYANEHDLSDKTISHETMESIYAPEIGKN